MTGRLLLNQELSFQFGQLVVGAEFTKRNVFHFKINRPKCKKTQKVALLWELIYQKLKSTKVRSGFLPHKRCLGFNSETKLQRATMNQMPGMCIHKKPKSEFLFEKKYAAQTGFQRNNEEKLSLAQCSSVFAGFPHCRFSYCSHQLPFGVYDWCHFPFSTTYYKLSEVVFLGRVVGFMVFSLKWLKPTNK